MTRLNPLTAHHSDAGFAPGSDERIARSAKAEERVKARLIREGMRAPVSESRFDLPPEFVEPAIARVSILLRHGNWEMAEMTIRRIAAEWELWQAERLPMAEQSESSRLAAHVNTLGLPTRTVEVLEARGIFTAGSLLESFPEKLIGARNCGPETIRRLAGALVAIGLLASEKAACAISKWELATSAI